MNTDKELFHLKYANSAITFQKVCGFFMEQKLEFLKNLLYQSCFSILIHKLFVHNIFEIEIETFENTFQIP